MNHAKISAKELKRWSKLLKEGKMLELFADLRKVDPVSTAAFLSGNPVELYKDILGLFSVAEQSEIFSYLPCSKQVRLYDTFNAQVYAKLLSLTTPEVRAPIYQSLTSKQQVALLPFLHVEAEQELLSLMAYSPQSAGSVMRAKLFHVTVNLSVQQVLERVRDEYETQETTLNQVYVVKENLKVLGIVSLEQMISVDPSTPIKKLLQKKFVYTTVDEPKRAVVKTMMKNNMLAIPVLGDNGCLLGTVRLEDIEPDSTFFKKGTAMEKFAGIMLNKRSEYLSNSSWEHFEGRVLWILGPFILSSCASGFLYRILGGWEIIANVAFCLPAMTGLGGSVGGQIATLIIKGLALGQVKIKDYKRILYKELGVVCLLLAVLLPSLIFVVWLALPSGELNLSMKVLGFLIVFTLLMLLIAMVLGSCLPLILSQVGIEPAQAANPAIMTLMDVSGLLICFGLSFLLTLQASSK